MSVSAFCCLDGLRLRPAAPRRPRESPIQLDTSFMGYEIVIVKGGRRVCGSGAALGNAPLVQSKAYFEVKVQQGGVWSVGLATRQTDLSLTIGGSDEYSWALGHDHVIRHDKRELYVVTVPSGATTDGGGDAPRRLQEGDVIGVAYDHIQLKFYVNGAEIDCPVANVKGTVYPALYVDDGAILDVVLDDFNYAPPSGFDKIMLEQSLL